MQRELRNPGSERPRAAASAHGVHVSFEPTHANDAWILSALIWNWRNARQFRSIRAHQFISEYKMKEAARLLHALINEYRGGRRPTSDRSSTQEGSTAAMSLPTRSVRQLIHRRGGELSKLLIDFETAFQAFAP